MLQSAGKSYMLLATRSILKRSVVFPSNHLTCRAAHSSAAAPDAQHHHHNHQEGAQLEEQQQAELERLISLMKQSRNVVVLTGAGCSTHSGLRDYRGPQGVYMSNPSFRPTTYSDFTGNDYLRKRYWARAFAGYGQLQRARANACHHGLAVLEKNNIVGTVITQNVDGLHLAAGSRSVVELHGSLHHVGCLACNATFSRSWFQSQMELANKTWVQEGGEESVDGDWNLPQSVYASFVVPPCPECGGNVKPRVVFFGENVEPLVVQKALDAVHAADMMLVMGSTLTVWSAMRIVAAAAGKKEHSPGDITPIHGRSARSTSAILLRVQGARPDPIPIAIVNNAPTRADFLATVKVEADVVHTVPLLVDAVCGGVK